MMTTSKFVVLNETDILATRSAGRELRAVLMNRLQDAAHIVVDFRGVSLTPSFADEFLGVTIQELGRDQFKQRITMVNLSESSKTLVRHILNARSRSLASGHASPHLPLAQHA